MREAKPFVQNVHRDILSKTHEAGDPRSRCGCDCTSPAPAPCRSCGRVLRFVRLPHRPLIQAIRHICISSSLAARDGLSKFAYSRRGLAAFSWRGIGSFGGRFFELSRACEVEGGMAPDGIVEPVDVAANGVVGFLADVED